ncbi:MAG: hypothetical protein ACK4Z8_01850 [Novosphingobium sp.]
MANLLPAKQMHPTENLASRQADFNISLKKLIIATERNFGDGE